ncbi:helix-turn-helix domain-containing protein [Belliella sp. R4-6]|uniref:Helix-turn-helix domain-containing protein n=1 Tax=Belliella alkalica TaxID=1730871 RepID=A0ABS9VGE4_9BACT|nr:helix-turn-helix domain-containing protein [Belliella alkalica]MCH7415239.1 helix-turn-helix domain-containing protein [Belliella alkalica]
MTKIELITKEDLEELRLQLLEDLQELLKLKPKEKDQRDWVKSDEVRRMLKISPGSLQNLRIRGLLNPKKIGGSYYYQSKEIENLFK